MKLENETNFRISEHIIKKIYVGLVILFFPLSVFATSQVGDILIWKGDTLKLFSNPLELRVNYDSLRVQILNEIEKLTYPEEGIDEERDAVFSTACWRGYIAEWIVLNDSIFLSNIYSCNNKNIKINMSDIFPNIRENQKLFASWINGNLYLPQGKCIRYINLDYQSIYERETVLNIENGLLKSQKTFHNQIAKKSDYFENALPGDLYEYTSKNINWKILPDLTNKKIQVFIGVQPNKKGQFERINKEYTYLIEYPVNDSISKVSIVTDTNNIFIKESIRIAKLIPEWDVIYQRGKIIGMSLMIDFSDENRKKYVH